jgi:hypothetical protein
VLLEGFDGAIFPDGKKQVCHACTPDSQTGQDFRIVTRVCDGLHSPVPRDSQSLDRQIPNWGGLRSYSTVRRAFDADGHGRAHENGFMDRWHRLNTPFMRAPSATRQFSRERRT